MQALRQAQAQQQQQVIQEQRAQGMARINRQISTGEESNSNLTIQLQVSTSQVHYLFILKKKMKKKNSFLLLISNYYISLHASTKKLQSSLLKNNL